MSGIVGIVHLDGAPVEPRLLQRLTDFQAFRGPHAQRVWSDGQAGFGHTLLKTTDDSAREQQPFTLGGNVWIVADARVDGRAELKTKLQEHCHENLDSTTDDALILRAYRVWGEECVQHLLGDFVFGIWDGPRQRLFCARDPLGVKPFFYTRLGSIFIFSNTLECVRQHPAVSNRLNDLAIADFLLFDLNQEPGTTSFADIQRLPPGHTLACKQEGLSIRRYWTLPVPATPIQYQRSGEYVEHFRDLLDTAVADRLRTNNAGILMSGGLDSTTVAASAQRVFARNGAVPGLQAYTEVFDSLIPHQERHYGGLAAKALKIPIEFRSADDERLFKHAEDPEYSQPEPIHIAWRGTWTEQLREMAKWSHTGLAGYGADPALSGRISVHFGQLLGKRQFGQALAQAAQYLTAKRRLSRLYIGKRLQILFAPKRGTSWYPAWLNERFEKRLELRDRWETLTRVAFESAAIRPEAYNAVNSRMWPLFFESYDAGATRVALELRHPFFDVRLLEYLLALPVLPWCSDKELLRATAFGTLPDVVRLRRKTPLPADPVIALLRRPESAYVDSFDLHPAMQEYVVRNRIPAVFEEKDPWTAWINLRPLSLNYWLRALCASGINNGEGEP